MSKNAVISVIKEAFKDRYIGENNGKHYVWVLDPSKNKMVQVSITLSAPIEKNYMAGDPPELPVEESPVVSDDWLMTEQEEAQKVFERLDM